MRKCLLLFFLLFCAAVFAQQSVSNNTPVVLKQLPPTGIVLNEGWKFQTGDNPAYANPDYDDSRWLSIDPTKDIYELPQLKSGIGWLRLKLQMDSAVLAQPLALLIQQVGASEIYVNGKLLRRYGTISAQPDKAMAYDPLGKPLPFQFVEKGENVLAVRYTLQPHLLYAQIMIRTNPAFFARVNNMETAVEAYQREVTRSTSSYIFRIGAFVLLFILHLGLYLYYPAQKANLFFSLYAALVLAAEIIATNIIHDVEDTYIQWNAVASFGQLGYFFLLTALYFLLNQKRGWVYWSLLALTILGVVLTATVYGMGFVISGFFIGTLVSIKIVHIAFRAVKNKQRGAWIIAAGTVSYFVFWIAFLYCVISDKLWLSVGGIFSLGDLLYNAYYLSIPFATSVFLALDFAFTSNSLQQKLKETKKLSQKSLEQEREKQQILASQKDTLERQVAERTAELNQSLKELKATQQQLIQQEKMASLGELTAGIAHEIQNPLNFVNNFSEINKELIAELKQEADKGNTAEVKFLVNDIEENEQKISYHGRRADAIVKGMLQHSRTSTGERQPTNINALTDEYLRLSYQGMRVKDKLFNTVVETHFDEHIGSVNVVPQDLARVLLNLFNNAFYAVSEKKKQLDSFYEPVVSVSTKKQNGRVEITVKDNGTGMPQKVADKIFQPFFTTKPTGEGTGLGLSLSYDIITKGHGGEMRVESKEGEYAKFIVKLPVL